ncbi:potassium/proton antiporter [Fusobacterium perfoetens]|uniref:potassium/proton antiporter n=1 Tax=Fusobacterium perfoetens TaxID=852 RepID=UPI0023F529CF|nr:potassium/proton antiporter [Fusobacterium perfoetens]MDY3237646.1 potassium/proton antiporter [Fusobacterium perfoetens]
MESYIFIFGLLLFFSLCSIKISHKIKVPLLIMFIFIGMLAGSEGIGGIEFEDYNLAQNIGNFALLFILFSGALETNKNDVISSLYPSGTLATLGVFLTAILSATFTYFLTNFSWMESLIFGAFVSSTDAAAVISILGESKLNKKVKTVIEIESGSNDPMAYALILFFISIYEIGNLDIINGIIFLLKQIIIGGALGFIFGKITIPISKFLSIKREEFLIIHVISFLFICYSLTNLLNGNGFLAIYLMGILVGNEKFEYRINLLRNMRAFSWIMQITMFLILGLLVFPSQLLSVIWTGSFLAILVIILGRFIVVFSLLSIFKFDIKEKFFVSWAGLKGAVPIIFSIMAVTHDLENSQMMFNMIFYMVVFSVLIQGTSLKFIAKYLGLLEKDEENNEISLDEIEELAIKKLYITQYSDYLNKQIKDLNLGEKGIHIISVKRGKNYLTPNGSLKFESGDEVLFSQN